MIWVIDASVAVKWFLADESNDEADFILERVVEDPRLFAVPELFCFEVYAVLERLHPEPLKVFRKAVLPVLEGGILRYPVTESLAKRANRFVKKGLTGYDACYAALAQELKGLWLTFDRKAHEKIADMRVSHLVSAGRPKEWNYH